MKWERGICKATEGNEGESCNKVGKIRGRR
jgi:hypothetical protein